MASRRAGYGERGDPEGGGRRGEEVRRGEPEEGHGYAGRPARAACARPGDAGGEMGLEAPPAEPGRPGGAARAPAAAGDAARLGRLRRRPRHRQPDVVAVRRHDRALHARHGRRRLLPRWGRSAAPSPTPSGPTTCATSPRCGGGPARSRASGGASLEWTHPDPDALVDAGPRPAHLGAPPRRRRLRARPGRARRAAARDRAGAAADRAGRDLEPVTTVALRRFVRTHSVVEALPTAVSLRAFAAVGRHRPTADRRAPPRPWCGRWWPSWSRSTGPTTCMLAVAAPRRGPARRGSGQVAARTSRTRASPTAPGPMRMIALVAGDGAGVALTRARRPAPVTRGAALSRRGRPRGRHPRRGGRASGPSRGRRRAAAGRGRAGPGHPDRRRRRAVDGLVGRRGLRLVVADDPEGGKRIGGAAAAGGSVVRHPDGACGPEAEAVARQLAPCRTPGPRGTRRARRRPGLLDCSASAATRTPRRRRGLAAPRGARAVAGADRRRRGGERWSSTSRRRRRGDGTARAVRRRHRLRQERAAAHAGPRPRPAPLVRGAQPRARRLQGRCDVRRARRGCRTSPPSSPTWPTTSASSTACRTRWPGRWTRRQEMLRAAGNLADRADYERARQRGADLGRCRRWSSSSTSSASCCARARPRRHVHRDRPAGPLAGHAPDARLAAARRGPAPRAGLAPVYRNGAARRSPPPSRGRCSAADAASAAAAARPRVPAQRTPRRWSGSTRARLRAVPRREPRREQTPSAGPVAARLLRPFPAGWVDRRPRCAGPRAERAGRRATLDDDRRAPSRACSRPGWRAAPGRDGALTRCGCRRWTGPTGARGAAPAAARHPRRGLCAPGSRPTTCACRSVWWTGPRSGVGSSLGRPGRGGGARRGRRWAAAGKSTTLRALVTRSRSPTPRRSSQV